MNTEKNPASDFLEISSEQRLYILQKLFEKKSKISIIAKELDATVPEVFRNFERMTKAGLIKKDTEGFYDLTTYGKSICIQIPSIVFVSQNKKYFLKHDFGELPTKFIQRIGSLQTMEHIKGFVKVLEQWKQIHKNADKYIYNILTEVPYSQDIIDTVASKLKNNIKIKSIIAENAVIPNERKEIFEKKKFQKFIKEGDLERRMRKNINVVLQLNEKEACLIFPKISEGPDMNEMFYSNDSSFHEWCLDYFEYCWNNSGTFQEEKLGDK